jgi:cation:H+ antiporter
MYEMAVSQAFVLALGSLGLGMVLLIRGGNWTIDAAIYIARHLGVSPLVVGFTIIAFGTSLPELIVSITANLKGSPGIAVGNVIGSNVANILLVLGVTAAIATIPAKPRDLLRDIIVMILATLYFVFLVKSGDMTRISGFVMLGLLLGYVLWQYKMATKGAIEIEEMDEPEFKSMALAVLFLLLGMAFIAIGAELLVRGAQVSAEIIGVPESVIGLTLIALGTSLPELSTCVIAALKKHNDIVLGNIIGSNVFNILMIIGATTAIKPIIDQGGDNHLIDINLVVMVGVTLLLSALLLFAGKIHRSIGFVFVGAYIVYIIAIYAMFMPDMHIPVAIQ